MSVGAAPPAGNGEPERGESPPVMGSTEKAEMVLLTFEDPKNKESYQVIVDASRRSPDPGEVDKFIASQLKEGTQELVAKAIK